MRQQAVLGAGMQVHAMNALCCPRLLAPQRRQSARTGDGFCGHPVEMVGSFSLFA